MNVRFFGGRKEEYVSIPKHNPIGLYFCADTRELFLGDRLLSDGMRVVSTFADLPSISEYKAAEGVIYFVEETKNGYVLPHGRSEWLQVIYAPTAGDGAEVDLSDYYTKAEVDEAILEAIANIKIEADLTGYATEAYVDEKLDAIRIPEVPTKVSELENDAGYLTKHQSLDGYATETFVKNAIAEAELNDKDVDLTGYVTKDELATVEAKIPSTEGFASEQFVLDKIAEVPTDYLKEIPSEYVTETELTEALKNIEYPSVDLSDYATVESVVAIADDLIQTQNQLDRVTSNVEELQKAAINLGASVVKQKYEVLPIDGMLIQYRDGEVRLNTQRVVPALQQVGETGNPNMYYVTFRAYAPECATSVIEGLNGNMDAKHSELATDSYGRKYTTIWAAIANTTDGGNTWTKWGDSSTLDKYLGFYYHFHWYSEDTLIGTDKVRVILTNDACHDDLVSDAVARRIDDKVSSVETVVTNITEQVQNIEETYVTKGTLEINYVTNTTLQENYITTQEIAETYVTEEKVTEVVTQEVNTVVTEQIETKVTEVIQEKVDNGEIAVKADSLGYGTF